MGPENIGSKIWTACSNYVTNFYLCDMPLAFSYLKWMANLECLTNSPLTCYYEIRRTKSMMDSIYWQWFISEKKNIIGLLDDQLTELSTDMYGRQLQTFLGIYSSITSLIEYLTQNEIGRLLSPKLIIFKFEIQIYNCWLHTMSLRNRT